MQKEKFVVERHIVDKTGTPALFCAKEDSAGSPLVIVIHGFTGRKELDLSLAYDLAMAGFASVVIDAAGHGERATNDGESQFKQDPAGFFYGLVAQTAEEIPHIIDYFAGDARCSDAIGITGISMGGFITFTAMTREPRIRAAAPLIGSPDWAGFAAYMVGRAKQQGQSEAEVSEAAKALIAKYDPMDRLDTLAGRALLVQNGDADEVVPIDGSRKLYDAVQELYADGPERFVFQTYPGVGHTVTEEMRARVIEWFRRWL